MKNKQRLMLIDGHAMAYRAYFATPPLTSPAGEPTNAVFGFASMLLKAVGDEQPDYVIATFDSGRTFRHEEYAEYKATRAKMPDDLAVQIERIMELARTLGIPVHTREGYEADDLMGSISALASKAGLETIIVTGDSDTLQLVSDDVHVLMPRRTMADVQLYDTGAVQQRYGLAPAQLIDLKALMGDSSDNIPGVKGVGEKTATALLKEYGSLDQIYEHLEDVSRSRFREALRSGREDALMSRHLVTVVRDLDEDLDLESARWPQFDRVRFVELLRELGFHSLIDRLPGEGPAPGEQLTLFATPAPANAGDHRVFGNYRIVDTTAILQELKESLQDCALFGLDTETTSTDQMQARLVGISIATAEGNAWYVPVGHERRPAVRQLSLDTVSRVLGPILADPDRPKVLHNAKYDLIVLERHGMPVRGRCEDTMLAAWLLSPTGRGISLREQAFHRLGVEMTDTSEVIGKGRAQTTMDKVAIETVGMYACADADMTLRLHHVLRGELADRDQQDLYDHIEVPLVPVLKEIVEDLFERRLIRVLYATETFAVGINFPVKSVCFDTVRKFNGVDFRPMTGQEYFQMAGRAGRRGIDEEGFVYILADLNFFRPEEFPSTDERTVEPLVSRFTLSYNTVVNLIATRSHDEIQKVLKQNFASYQQNAERKQIEKELAAARELEADLR